MLRVGAVNFLNVTLNFKNIIEQHTNRIVDFIYDDFK